MKELKSGSVEDEAKESLLEGRVIECLKDSFMVLQQAPEGDRDPTKFLSKKCAVHIEKIMKDEAEDFKLDPQLLKHCEVPLDSSSGMCNPMRHSDPIECLKKQFMDEAMKGENMIPCRKYVAKLIKESQVAIVKLHPRLFF